METVAPFAEIIEEINQAGGEAFKYCYQCGKCDVVCPWNRVRPFSIRKIVWQAALGLPVIPLVASKNQGMSELIATAEHLARQPESFQPTRPEIAEPHRNVQAQVRTLLTEHVPAPYREDWIALKLLEGDMEVTGKAQSWLPENNWSSGKISHIKYPRSSGGISG